MNVIANPCPCGQHPAERGTIYGSINALVCSSVPGTAMYFFPDPRPRDYLFAHPQVLRYLNLTAITKECSPEFSPAAYAVTKEYVVAVIRALVRLDPAYASRWVGGWESILREMWAARALDGCDRDPDPRLGEGAVSPTRHLRN